MEEIIHYMTAEHRRCDGFFAEAERLAATGDWEAATAAYRQFHDATEHHFTVEEEVLFPAIEQASGSPMGPTQVMRMEHRQMRDLFSQMQAALVARMADDYLGAAETLFILMQQHNMKEEQILYPMADRLLGAAAGEVLQQMGAAG